MLIFFFTMAVGHSFFCASTYDYVDLAKLWGSQPFSRKFRLTSPSLILNFVKKHFCFPKSLKFSLVLKTTEMAPRHDLSSPSRGNLGPVNFSWLSFPLHGSEDPAIALCCFGKGLKIFFLSTLSEYFISIELLLLLWWTEVLRNYMLSFA